MKRILVVDDAKDINLMLSNYLKKSGFNVTSVYNGTEAINLISYDENFDLIILDMIMPDQDGLDVINYMRKNNNATPVIGMSAGGTLIEKSTVLKAAERHVNSIIEKPFTPEQLIKRINKALEK